MESENISSHIWGHYATLHHNNEKNYKVKKIVLEKGKEISLQSHTQSYKHWIICTGTAKVQLQDKYIILSDNAHVFIPIDTKHSIENIGEEDIEFIEIKLGELLNEEDIVVHNDDPN